jgi:ribonuclease VapC
VTLVLDTSAIAAVVFGEPDAEALLSVMISHAGDLQISAATLVEVGTMVEAKQGQDAAADLRTLLDTIGVVTSAFDADQAEVAAVAWRRFGKGRHPAGLNLGDCYSYALAKVLAAPLLFKGLDFAQTDVASAL